MKPLSLVKLIGVPIALAGLFLTLLLVYSDLMPAPALIGNQSPAAQTKPPEKTLAEIARHYSYFAESASYDRAFAAVKNSLPETKKIYGGIAPHHLVAAELIADFYWRLRDQKIKTVIIVGPNHFESGYGDILTSQAVWQTPYGDLQPNQPIINQLIGSKIVYAEEAPFIKEHSISAHVAFIKKVWPDATIVPLILKYETNEKEAALVADVLNQILDENTLVVASVDFSHHLPPWLSAFHDQFSLGLIDALDHDRLRQLEIDSPASIDVLLRYLESKRAAGASLLAHESAATILNTQEIMDNTSYVTQYFASGSATTSSPTSLLLLGDLMLDRNVESLSLKHGGFAYPFQRLAGAEGQFFKGVDAIVANLEGPIVAQPIPTKKEISFVFKPEIVKTLQQFNFSILGLANNHTSDQGLAGLQSTRNYLKQGGIDPFGDPREENFSSVLIKKFGDQRVAFVGFNASDHPVSDKKITGIISQAAAASDFVIVFVHWGIEYQRQPSIRQKQLAKIFIDAGADTVIGHHPHVIQTIEKYKGRLIFYSLGNFIFDQDFSPQTKEGIALGLVTTSKAVTYHLLPYAISAGQAYLMASAEKTQTLEQLAADSSLDETLKKNVKLGIITLNRDNHE